MSAYGRPGKFGQKKEGEEPADGQVVGNRRKIKSGNRINGIEPLHIHFEQVENHCTILVLLVLPCFKISFATLD